VRKTASVDILGPKKPPTGSKSLSGKVDGNVLQRTKKQTRCTAPSAYEEQTLGAGSAFVQRIFAWSEVKSSLREKPLGWDQSP
jgi:hypothetical protein